MPQEPLNGRKWTSSDLAPVCRRACGLSSAALEGQPVIRMAQKNDGETEQQSLHLTHKDTVELGA